MDRLFVKPVKSGSSFGITKVGKPDRLLGAVDTALIGRDGPETISAEQVADEAGTITNELLSRLGSRLKS